MCDNINAIIPIFVNCNTTPEEKKQKLHTRLEIAMTVELEREEMKSALAQMMIEDNEPVDKIERYTGYTFEKLGEIPGTVGKTLMTK